MPNISPSNYGENVNYSINFNGDELDEWKIFYSDNELVYMIYNGTIPFTNEVWNDSEPVNYLNNNSNWEFLLSDNLKSNGAKAKGTVDLETWVSSWNSMGYAHIDILYDSTGWIGFENSYDYVWAEGTTVGFKDDRQGVDNSLYFSNDGYSVTQGNNSIDIFEPLDVLKSEEIYGQNISWIGARGYDLGMRPLIAFPLRILSESQDGGWNIIGE